jgi:hypothetical protein
MKDNNKISIDCLCRLRKEFEEIVQKLEDKNLTKYFSSIQDALLLNKLFTSDDIKKRGVYRGLLLGVDNLDIIKKFAGIKATGFIKEDSPYFIEIGRAFREDTVSFEFFENLQELSEKRKLLIEKVFQNANSETVDISRFLNDQNSDKIPSLIIKIPDPSFLNNPDDDVKSLLGDAHLVKQIKIKISIASTDDDVCSYINTLDILTPNYYAIDTIMDNPRGLLEKNYSSYNFILLNDENDFLVKLFLRAIKAFKSDYNIDVNNSKYIINNVFYSTKENYINNTRLFAENPEYKEFLFVDKFENSLEFRHLKSNVLYVLAFLISIAINERIRLMKKISSPTPPELIKDLINDYGENIIIDTNQLIPLFEEQKNKLEQFEEKLKSPLKLNDRNIFFNNYEDILNSSFYFVKKYCCNLENQIEEEIRNIAAERKVYTKKISKFIFSEQYEKHDKDFTAYVLNKKGFMKNTIVHLCLKDSIGVQSISMFLQKIEGIKNQLNDNISYSNTEFLLCELENKISQGILKLMSDSGVVQSNLENNRNIEV